MTEVRMTGGISRLLPINLSTKKSLQNSRNYMDSEGSHVHFPKQAPKQAKIPTHTRGLLIAGATNMDKDYDRYVSAAGKYTGLAARAGESTAATTPQPKMQNKDNKPDKSGKKGNPHKCKKCGYFFDLETLGKYGCPNLCSEKTKNLC